MNDEQVSAVLQIGGLVVAAVGFGFIYWPLALIFGGLAAVAVGVVIVLPRGKP